MITLAMYTYVHSHCFPSLFWAWRSSLALPVLLFLLAVTFLVHNGAGVSSRSHAGAGLQNGTDVVLAAVLHSGDAREDAGADPQNLTKVVVAAVKISSCARKTRERGPEEQHGGGVCCDDEKWLCPADTRSRT